MASGATMAQLFLVFLLLAFILGTWVKEVNSQQDGDFQTWCVAKPSASEAILQQNVDYVCGLPGISCSKIQPGGECYLPFSQISHASVAMNLYYSAYGRLPSQCDFHNSGIITITNPSYGNCVYP